MVAGRGQRIVWQMPDPASFCRAGPVRDGRKARKCLVEGCRRATCKINHEL